METKRHSNLVVCAAQMCQKSSTFIELHAGARGGRLGGAGRRWVQKIGWSSGYFSVSVIKSC